ncbi:hypothetical protein ACWPKS_18180 [Coraliomargarita sp. W4R72]
MKSIETQEAQLLLKLQSADNPADVYYDLYRLFATKRRTSEETAKLVRYRDMAAEAGHLKCAIYSSRDYRYGYHSEKKPSRSAYFYAIAAELGHGYSRNYLGQTLAKNPIVRKSHGEAMVTRWIEARSHAIQLAKQQAIQDMALARKIYLQAGTEAFQAAMNSSLAKWRSKTTDHYDYHYTSRIWWEAQTQTGRSDVDWSQALYTWLAAVFDEDTSTAHDRVGARHNLAEALVTLGRFGRLREVADELNDHIYTQDGVDIAAEFAKAQIGPNYKFNNTKFPVLVNMDQVTVRKRYRSKDEPIAAFPISAMYYMGYERLSVGNWEYALFLSEWIEAWIEHLETEQAKPERDYPGYFPNIHQNAFKLKAQVFGALGLTEQEEAAYQHIIELDYSAYGGETQDWARTQLASLLASQGRAAEVDIENLIEVETRIRNNKFESEHTWKHTQLARARVLHALGKSEEALKRSEAILQDESAHELPELRLDALLTTVQCLLALERHQQVENNLSEALDWCRVQGLLLKEMRVYELYVQYLEQTGDFEAALKMQQRVVELIEAMRLKPRLKAALAIKNRLHEQWNSSRHTEAKKWTAAPQSTNGTTQIEGTPDGDHSNSPIELAADLTQIDLQPMRIVSMVGENQAEAVFTISNYGINPVSFTLKTPQITAKTLNISDSDVISIHLSEETTDLPFESSVLHLEPAEQKLIQLVAAPSLTGENENTYDLVVVANGRQFTSEWQLNRDEARPNVSVTNAAHIRENPFYLVPTFHQIENRSETEQAVALRAIASRPTRIEAYDQEGTLLFVDANGNGWLGDSGDLVKAQKINELSPVLEVSAAGTRLELLYQPIDRKSADPVEIQIQTKDLNDNVGWQTDAIDWLELDLSITE